jgi:uncharacterized protein DUF4266
VASRCSFDMGTLRGSPNPPAMGSGERSSPTPYAIRLFLLIVLLAAGCSTRAWLVKPHQRGYLADRIMRLDAEAQQKKADQHVMVYREGAVGGDGTAGGGCGCN